MTEKPDNRKPEKSLSKEEINLELKKSDNLRKNLNLMADRFLDWTEAQIKIEKFIFIWQFVLVSSVVAIIFGISITLMFCSDNDPKRFDIGLLILTHLLAVLGGWFAGGGGTSRKTNPLE